jgi:two-component system CheB/CheR fusion protein
LERALVEYLSQAPVFVRSPQGEIIYWTAGCEELYGYSLAEARGRVSHDLLQTVFPAPLGDIERRLAATGTWSGRLRHTTKQGDEVWTQSLWRVRNGKDPAGPVVVEQNTDITALVRAERRQAMLMQELNHRVKNTLAVVQGLLRLTFTARDERAIAFEERLIALSQAHAILMRESWERASLRELIGDIGSKLHVGDRIVLDGPEVELQPAAVVPYALAFHELATNALKHGALSTPAGRVEVTWRRRPAEGGGDTIHLLWRERGGPRVSAPEREGFGSRLLRRAVATELGAPVDLRWEPAGLVCEFEGPLQKAAALCEPGGRAG